MSWDEALADIAGRLQAVIDHHGGEGILPYAYAGTQGFVQCSLMDQRLFATIVVIDPQRTRTARAADWHIQPAPGTDARGAGGDRVDELGSASPLGAIAGTRTGSRPTTDAPTWSGRRRSSTGSSPSRDTAVVDPTT